MSVVVIHNLIFDSLGIEKYFFCNPELNQIT